MGIILQVTITKCWQLDAWISCILGVFERINFYNLRTMIEFNNLKTIFWVRQSANHQKKICSVQNLFKVGKSWVRPAPDLIHTNQFMAGTLRDTQAAHRITLFNWLLTVMHLSSFSDVGPWKRTVQQYIRMDILLFTQRAVCSPLNVFQLRSSRVPPSRWTKQFACAIDRVAAD